MAGMSAKVDYRQLEEFQKRLQQLADQKNMNDFINSCAKELAARLLAKVVRRTPVGNYARYETVTATRDTKNHKKGETFQRRIKGTKIGGTLRRGWTGEKKANVQDYAMSLPVEKRGDVYTITIINPVYYAPYVEFGHRTRGGKGWVEGQFMLTESERELAMITPKILEDKLQKYLGELFNGK